MSQAPPRFAIALIALATAGGPFALGDEPENLRRLQAMPLERRAALAENLERFDKLDAAERASIRKLDAEIARKDPVEQERYRALLRRYHLWVNGLTEEEREQLKAADGADARLALVRKLRGKEAEAGSTGPRIAGIRTGDFGLIAPHEAAHLLRTWKLLTPEKKLEVDRQRERSARLKSIAAQAKTVGVAFQPFPAADEARYDAQLNGDEAFKKMVGQEFARRVNPTPKKAEAALAKGETPHQRFVLRYPEFLYYEEHKPKSVSRANLERFSASCPNWFHELIDPLSPDDARAYLTVVYRLLYPDPAEMPAEPRSAKGADPARPPVERPAPKKSGSPAPF